MRIEMRMARPCTGRTGIPTNLYLSELSRIEGTRIAKTRYNESLSELVNRLLKKEIKRRKRAVRLKAIA